MPQPDQHRKGRAAVDNVANRFERIASAPLDESVELDERTLVELSDQRSQSLPTVFLPDDTRSIISENNSPDIPFRYSLNPYRGCEHGCSYCYARPSHEFLGLSAGLDFESKILVKDNAVELLREQLSKPSWQPEAFMMSGVTDPYQPIERSRKLTRGLIELLHDCKHPLSVITKNAMIERDVDLLGSMAKQGLAHAAISVTTLDPELARDLEPRTSSPAARLRAITTLADAGVPVRIMTAPVIPGLTDHEIPKLLQAAKDAGATSAGYVMLRLPGSVAPVFTQWLSRVRPEAKDRVMAKVTRIRGGKSSDSHFHTRMRGTGFDADQIANLFRTFCKQLGLNRNPPAHRTDLFQPPTPPSGQLSLF